MTDIKRYSANTPGLGLELQVLEGQKKPSLRPVTELALRGLAPLLRTVKTGRLQIKAIEELIKEPEKLIRKTVPSNLYGISIDGLVEAQLSPQHTTITPELEELLDLIGDSPVIDEVTIPMEGVDPERLLAVMKDNFPGIRIQPKINKERLDKAVQEGLDDPRPNFERKPKSKRLLIDMFGPDGKKIETYNDLPKKPEQQAA